MNLFDTYKDVKKSKVPDIVNKLGLKYEVFITDKEYEDLTHAKSVFKDSRVILHKTLKGFSGKDNHGYTLKRLNSYPKELPLQVLNALDEFYNKYSETIEKDEDMNHFYILAPSRGFTKSGLANGDIDLDSLTFKEVFKSLFYNSWDSFKEMFDDFYIIKRGFYLTSLIGLTIVLLIINILLFNETEDIPDQIIVYFIFNFSSISIASIFLAFNLCEKYIKPFKHVMFIIGYSVIINLAFLSYKWPKLEGIHNWESRQGKVKIKVYKDKPLMWDKVK